MSAFQLNALRATRKNILNFLHACNLGELNHIPPGFNNNLLWNAGHVTVTQQLLCYRLAGLEVGVSEEMIAEFKKGSKPERRYTEDDKKRIGDLLFSTLEDLERDLAEKDFSNFTPYPTSYGVTLHNIEEAVQFNLAHEAMHLGTMLGLKKLVNL